MAIVFSITVVSVRSVNNIIIFISLIVCRKLKAVSDIRMIDAQPVNNNIRI